MLQNPPVLWKHPDPLSAHFHHGHTERAQPHHWSLRGLLFETGFACFRQPPRCLKVRILSPSKCLDFSMILPPTTDELIKHMEEKKETKIVQEKQKKNWQAVEKLIIMLLMNPVLEFCNEFLMYKINKKKGLAVVLAISHLGSVICSFCKNNKLNGSVFPLIQLWAVEKMFKNDTSGDYMTHKWNSSAAESMSRVFSSKGDQTNQSQSRLLCYFWRRAAWNWFVCIHKAARGNGSALMRKNWT